LNLISTANEKIDVWRQLNPNSNRLVRLKIQAAVKKLRKEIEIEKRRIYFNNRGTLNPGIIPTQILAMELHKIDEWAANYYSLYSEVWEQLGNKKSAAFVRTIYDNVIRPLIASRRNAVVSEAKRLARRTGGVGGWSMQAIKAFNHWVDQLAADWSEKIEIEAETLELEARRQACRSKDEPERTPQKASVGPISSVARLSAFEETVGKLMAQARRRCPAKCLSQTEILKIATVLDDQNFPVRDNLERRASHEMAEHNQHYSKAAIKTWTSALNNPKFRRAVRKRFSRAEEKYKRAIWAVGALSAGTSRTTI
jgi:hypothetical protein